MTQLSENEKDIITAHPIGDGLQRFCASFESKYLDHDETNLTTVLERFPSKTSAGDTVLDLLLALQSQSAARILRSRKRDGFLFLDIASICARVPLSQVDVNNSLSLLRLVVNQKGDDGAPATNNHDIWSAVFDLVTLVEAPVAPVTPPQTTLQGASFQQTPWSYTTGTLEDSSELRSDMDRILKAELLPSLRLDVPDIYETLFGRIPDLDNLADVVFNRCQEGETPLYKDGVGWTQWPPSASEELVLEWLQKHTKLFSGWAEKPGRQLYQGPGRYLRGSTAKRKLDVGIVTARHGFNDLPVKEWSQMLVLGELKSHEAKNNHCETWIDLATYVREIFKMQERRFVLGFTLCGSMMRLWHVDHLGTSGGLSFDINQDGHRFVQVMLGYFMMDNQQLGLDPTIANMHGKQCISIDRNGQTEQVILEKLLRKQAVVVGRATTCWKAYCEKDQGKVPLIVKDSWQYTERPEEGLLIKEATDSGVLHVARYYHHETVQVNGKDDDIIANVRQNQMKDCGRTSFTQTPSDKPDVSDPDAFGKIILRQVERQSATRKRSSGSMKNPSSPKRKRSIQMSQGEAHNRVRRRIITCDPGKSIESASSLTAMLNGMIGAIAGHESLLNAGILHRDISTGNILLTEDEESGFLIDLDLAIRLSDHASSGAPSKTGTKVFMAIGALHGEHHSFMHDLESFFWVLLWVGIHWNGPGKERAKLVNESWNYLRPNDLADLKVGRVASEHYFHTYLGNNLTPYCEPLIGCIEEMRKVVFPDGKPWMSENRDLYGQIRAVLESARDGLKTQSLE